MTFLERAWRIADKNHWEEECTYLRDVFKKNDFSVSEIDKTFALFKGKYKDNYLKGW